ncbi:PTS sugar transporter subunit IID [Candidatus Epulonipiscioides gigas]|nr:PTS sugar transporter subunit IID [Epulopiscium sp. SCG-C07WGA-EpuloA2]
MTKFLKKKDIEISLNRYGIAALSAMAQGLFCSLLIGTILKIVGQQIGIEILISTGSFASQMSGAAMAIAIGFALKSPPLVLFSLTTVGFIANIEGGAGGPLAVLFITIIAAECGKFVSKETKIDILVTPTITICVGTFLSLSIAPYIANIAMSIGNFIQWATELAPFFMGIIIAVVVGITLTLPISSAAICAAFSITGLAGGAALTGCCAHMIGFAFMGFKDNGISGIVSQGIGTSMLQMPNLVKKPILWLPPIITSIIIGPISTVFFKLEMNGEPISSGMGTCGFVGQIGTITGWFSPSEAALLNGAISISPTSFTWIGLIMVCFILPGIICSLIGILFRKFGYLKEGDLKI